jgi:HTH-type transcriptional regulator, sugar sensing transcriptional regulator
MESVVEKLQHVGLTEYEAKAYLGLINTHFSTATQVSERSGVPRTKIYSVLESLGSSNCMMDAFEGGWHYAQKW